MKMTQRHQIKNPENQKKKRKEDTPVAVGADARRLLGGPTLAPLGKDEGGFLSPIVMDGVTTSGSYLDGG